VQKSRLLRFAGVLLLLIASGAQAVDDEYRSPVREDQSALPMVQALTRRVVTLPAELVGLFFGRHSEAVVPANDLLDAYATSAQRYDFDRQRTLFQGDAQRRVQLILSESRFRVWLRHDLNLQCDLEQDRAIAQGDQFSLKLALQFRFH
jgi:hypothetical protein